VRVSVKRLQDYSSREVEDWTENFGFGGLFVLANPPFLPETRVVVSIASAITWDPLRLSGTVRWVRDTGSSVLAGMGIALDPLSPDHAFALYRLFESLGFETL
jgi:hypothetical protein